MLFTQEQRLERARSIRAAIEEARGILHDLRLTGYPAEELDELEEDTDEQLARLEKIELRLNAN